MNIENKQETREVKTKKKFNKWMIAVMLLVFLVLIYTVTSIYFMNHYFFNTTINGESFSLKSLKKSKEIVRESVENFELTLLGREDLSDVISGKEFDLKYVGDDELRKILDKQNCFFWVESIFKKSKYDLAKGITYDKEKLNQTIGSLSFFEKANRKVPIDAYISEYSKKTKRFEIVPEYIGSTLKKSKVEEEVYYAVDNFVEIVDLDKSKCYENPQKYSNDKRLIRQLNQYNLYSSAVITYEFGDNTVVLDGDTINKWLYVHGILVFIDEEMASEYIRQLADTYDTYGKNRLFTTVDGREKELYSGAYGWKIDQQEELKELSSIILLGKKVVRQPVYTSVAAVRGANDIGETYIEIDLSLQHLYLHFEGNILIESDIVSGNISELNATPAGVFGISYRTRNAILRGDTWETPVDFWMPFNGGIGLHDAIWRKNFGKDIYLANGSHGCINLPYSAAKEIYEYVFQGMPVICYY